MATYRVKWLYDRLMFATMSESGSLYYTGYFRDGPADTVMVLNIAVGRHNLKGEILREVSRRRETKIARPIIENVICGDVSTLICKYL